VFHVSAKTSGVKATAKNRAKQGEKSNKELKKQSERGAGVYDENNSTAYVTRV